MYSPSKQEQLRKLLKEQYAYLQQTFATDRQSALLALTRSLNRHYLETLHHKPNNASLYTLGWQKALSLCFAASPPSLQTSETDDTLNMWADATLQACGLLVQAERILDYCETGFLRMQQSGDTFNVWVASKKMPTEWREQEDLSIWTNILTQTYASAMHALQSERTQIQQQLIHAAEQWDGQADDLYITTRTVDDYYHRLGLLHVKSMVPYNTYLASTTIGGCTFAVYRDVLSVLIGLALKHCDLCTILFREHSGGITPYIALSWDDNKMVETLSTTLAIETTMVRLALDAYTLDAENASYHYSAADGPTPPLIRLDNQHRTWSLAGLLINPLFFLMHELGCATFFCNGNIFLKGRW